MSFWTDLNYKWNDLPDVRIFCFFSSSLIVHLICLGTLDAQNTQTEDITRSFKLITFYITAVSQPGYIVDDKLWHWYHTTTMSKEKASTAIKELKTFNDFANNIFIWINKTLKCKHACKSVLCFFYVKNVHHDFEKLNKLTL